MTLANSIKINPSISYEPWDMPAPIKPTGVLGLHELIFFNHYVYSGVGLYSAIVGEKGGFFALALEGGAQYPIILPLFLDGGVRVGGGGGHNTPVGGGLFYEPYIGLKYDFKNFTTELYYSYVNFVDGKISSDQIGLMMGFPFEYDFHHKFYENNSDNYIAALSKIYFPDNHSIKTDGRMMKSDVEFLGFEFGHFFTHELFLFLNFSGAIHGNENGYADELLGLGYRLPLLHSAFSAIVKLAAGSGGGGAVNTGGGFIYNPILGLEYSVNSALSVELDGGYIDAPKGHFSAKEFSVLLKYYFSRAHVKSNANAWRVRILNQTYFKPRSSSGVDNPTMQLLGLDVDYFMSRYFYMTGQTAFAYVGKETGGYFSGLLGLGAQTKKFGATPLNAFSEILVGTAGGAGLSIGDGALVEPIVGLQYQFTHAVTLQTSVGYLMALKGQFHPVTLSIGIGYQF